MIQNNRLSLILLLCVGSLFTIWLLLFTLSGEFATFNSDSANYVLLAKKWSPYFVPSDMVTNTWPMQTFPVAFPLFLAFFGLSNSLFLCHLAVSMFLLSSLILIFFLLNDKFGTAISLITTLSLGLLPGMFVNSMGILSENLFMFLSIFLITILSRRFSNGHFAPATAIMLVVTLLMFTNTRTIGVVIIPAILVVMIFDKSICGQTKKYIGIVIALVSLVWLGWNSEYSFQGSTSYINLLKPSLMKSLFGYETDKIGLMGIVHLNITHLPYAWNEYLTLSFGQRYYPLISIFSLAVLCITQICTVVRAVNLKLDALYIIFYFLVLIIWPFPISDRFLHPIAILLLLQPLFFAHESKTLVRKYGIILHTVIMLVILGNSLFVHSILYERKSWAKQNNPQLARIWEMYKEADMGKAVRDSQYINNLFNQTDIVKSIVPAGKVLVANKPVFVALLTERATVPLKTDIPLQQQYCNFHLKGVDYIYLSSLITDYSIGGLGAEKTYASIIKNRYLINENGKHVATVGAIDKGALTARLKEPEFDCVEFDLFPFDRQLSPKSDS